MLPGLRGDYLRLVSSAVAGKLIEVEEDSLTRVCIVGASRGYPVKYEKGRLIRGLEDAAGVPGVSIYGAGLKLSHNQVCGNGGRLFSIVGEHDDIIGARQKAYAAMAFVSVEGNGLHYRTDIGWRDVERQVKHVVGQKSFIADDHT